MGHKNIVKYLVEHGADVNAAIDKFGQKQLFYAVKERNESMVNLLINCGANVNAVNKSGWTPLFYAKDVQTAQLLISHGADVNWKSENDGHTWLTHTMVYEGLPTEENKLPMIEFILKQLSKEKINESTNIGNTASHMASRWNYAEITKMLVNHGADIHLRNGKGETPLMRTAQFDSAKVARVLLDTNEISSDEINKALEYAKKFCSTESVELLSNAVKKMKQQ